MGNSIGFILGGLIFIGILMLMDYVDDKRSQRVDRWIEEEETAYYQMLKSVQKEIKSLGVSPEREEHMLMVVDFGVFGGPKDGSIKEYVKMVEKYVIEAEIEIERIKELNLPPPSDAEIDETIANIHRNWLMGFPGNEQKS